jgi:hypothetical protein
MIWMIVFLGFTPIASGSIARASVERALYERTGSPHFYVRIRIENLTDRPIGVALGDRRRTIYVNQWGYLSTPHRLDIDETRAPPPPGDPAAPRTTIPPHGTLDAYREFNASGRRDVDAQHGTYPYLFLSMDGVLDVTGEELGLSWIGSRSSVDTDVIIGAPVSWQLIPPGALVIDD